MPSDSSIYGLVRQPAPITSPLDMLTQQLQIKHLMDTGALNSLQRQQLEQQLTEHQNVMQAFAGLQPGQDVESVLPSVLKASPTTGISLQKNLLEGKKTRAEIGKLDLEAQAAKAKDARDSLAGVYDQATYDAWKQSGAEKGYQVAMQAPPAYSTDWQRQHLMTADQFIAQTTPKFEKVELGGKIVTVDTNPLTNPAIRTMQFKRTLGPEGEISAARAQYEGVPLPAGLAPRPAATPPGPALGPQPAPTAPRPPATPLDTAPRSEIDKLPPKARDELLAKRTAEKPKDESSLEEMVAKTDQTIDQAKVIQKHPGLWLATGKTYLAGSIPGTAAYDASKLIDTLKSQVMLSQLQSFRAASANGSSGFGQLSDKEGETLRNAITNLDRAQTSEQFKAALQNVIDTNEGIKERMKTGFKRLYDVAPQIKSYSTNPLTPGGAQTVGGKIKFLGLE